MGRAKGNILNKLHIFKTNFYIFVLEVLYRAHIHIRYLHDKVYQRGGTYKKYSDSPVSSYVHRASMLAFVFSFIVFQFMQNVWPYMFTFKPREVKAGQNSVTWTAQDDWNGTTQGIATTSSNIDLTSSSGDVKVVQNSMPVNTVDNGNGTWTTTLQPGSEGTDTFIRQGYGSIGYGTSSSMVVETGEEATCSPQDGGCFVPSEARSYVQFDLSSIPAGSSVTDATLSTYVYRGAGTANLYKVTSAWTESSYTFPNNDVSVAATSSFNSSAWGNLSITSLAQGWYNGSISNYGVALKKADTDYYLYSSDYTTDPSLRPKLAVTYSPVVYATQGNIGGSGASDVGLRKDVGEGIKASWSSVTSNSTALASGQAIKFGIRTSDDGTTWSEILGNDGAAIDWTTGTGNYLGKAASDGSARTTITGISGSRYLDIVVRLESNGSSTPTLNDITLTYDNVEAPVLANTTIYKSDGTTAISTNGTEGVWTNETSVKVTAIGLTCTNCGTSNQRKIEMEVKPIATAFDGTATGGFLVQGDYNDTTFASTATITGLAVGTSYHSRLRTIDAQGRVSGWTSYGSGSDTPTATADFSIEQTAPTGTVSVAGVEQYTSDTAPDLTLSASDTGGSGLSQMRFSNDGSAWSSWETYGTSKTNWALSAGDGDKTVYAQFIDNAGNVSVGSIADSITLDTAAPIVPRDNISDPVSFPANNTLRAPNGGESWGGGTLKTIVWNKDNITDGTGSGLSATPVNLYYSGSGAAPWTSVASNLTNGANAANGSCTPDAGTGCYTWRLPNTVDSTNMKVKVEFVDTVGNKVDYNNDSAQNADTSDSVFSSTSDSTPPTAFTISGSSPDNNDWTDATPDISWSASTDPESGPVTYELWMTQAASPTYPTDFTKRTDVGSAGTINVTNATPTLTGLEGSWYYFVRATNGAYDAGDTNTYRDVGYGISSDTTHYFRVDDAKPTGTVTATVIMSSETDATSSYLVDLVLTQNDGAGSGTNMVQFSNDNVFYCSFASYTTPQANFDLRDDCAGGTTLTSRGTRTVYMKLKDAAGNTSNVITDTIIYDITNPNIPASVSSSIQGTVVSGSTNTVRVTWTDIADPPEAAETVSGIDGYNIYRSDSFNPSYTKINGSLVAPAAQLYDDATATDGVNYNYKVEAVDNAGNTNTNNTATSQSLTDKTAPSDVDSFTAGGTDDTTIGLSWDSTADNATANGGKANKYYVQRTGALGGTEPVIAGSDPSFSYSALVTVNFEEAGKYDSGTDRYSYTDTVQAQQWYYYKIKAEDSASPTPYQSSSWIYFKSRGNFAPTFNINDIVITANNGHNQNTVAPGDIVNFSFPITDADGEADLNAGNGNALETVRIVDALSAEQLTVTQVTSKIQDVTNGYTFSYNYTVPSTAPYGTYTATLRVKDSVAVDGSTHDISRNVNFKVIPEKPTSVSVSGTNSTTLTVSWTAPGNAGNRTGLRASNTYSVRRADTSGGTYSHIGYATSASYADNGLTMNEDYYYKIVAFDVSNNEGILSDISGTSGTTTPTPAVPQASSVKMIDASTVDEGQNRFLLVWGDPTADPNNNTTTANFANFVVEKAENCANNVDSCIFSNAGETDNKYFVDVSLSNTTDYTYRIHVKDSFANLSRNDISPVKEGKPGAKPSVSIVSEATGVSTARVKWTATQEAETQVVYSTNQSQLSDANAKVNIAGIGGRRLAGEDHDVELVGLSPNTTYYYKIVSRNILGFANDVAVRTIKTQDFTIQNISNVTTTTTATVHWTTNIDSDSNVEYKKEARIGESAEESKTAGDPKLTKDHEVVIKALRPDTSYTYKIRSVTSDKYISETAFLTFKTKPYDASQFTITPNASSIAEQNITATSAKIVWNTAVATTSWLDYGTSAGSYNQSAGDDKYNTVHVVELVNLTPGTKYFYKVRGKDTNDIEYTSQEYSFTAVLLPQILNPKTSGLTSYTISMDWETNVSATSFVAYGKDTTYGSGVGKTEPSKAHSTKLENLEDNTTYHYQITVKDQFGNEAKSADLTFATPIDTAGPEVREVKIDILPMGTDDETASAIISWTTSKPATTKVEYEEGVLGGNKYANSSIEDPTLNTSHTVIVKELTPSTTYRFRLDSKDKRGNTTNSKDYTLVTPTKEKSILQLIIRSLEETFSWVSQMPNFFRGLGSKIMGR